MHGKLSQITLTKLFFCIFIVILLTACVSSFIRTKSDLINHHLAFKLNQIKKYKFDEYHDLAKRSEENIFICPTNPRTYLLAGNTELSYLVNAHILSSREIQKTLFKAKQYYIAGLKHEPNNPFLWINFALVLANQPEQKKHFQNATNMAKKYGGHHPEIKLMINKLLNK
jgi:hypothetical protein